MIINDLRRLYLNLITKNNLQDQKLENKYLQ